MKRLWLPVTLMAVISGVRSAERICRHPLRGSAARVSLDRVKRGQREIAGAMAFAVDRVRRLDPAGPFESGLPACRRRTRRIVPDSIPRKLVGKTIAFAPSERMPEADMRVATSAKRLDPGEMDALADERLVRRLHVRCTPTLVRVVSEVELELLEDH